MSSEVRDNQVANFSQALLQTVRTVLKPPTDLTLSEWSERHMYLSAESSALPGRFSFRRAEYQRGVFDALSDPTVERVVIMAASQTMKSQAILNLIGYTAHTSPSPILVVQPTEKMLRSFSKDRVDTLIRDVPELSELFPNKRTRDSGNTLTHKKYPGGYIAFGSSNSPSDLAARPIRVLLLDEVDRYEPTSEGDPVEIAIKRTTTFHDRKIVEVSSPGDDEISRIAPDYERSDKRIFLVPCHECGVEQRLLWKTSDGRGGVKFDPTDPSTARYECSDCGALWTESQKNQNVSKGRWKATASSSIVGFHISAIYSSFITLEELAREFLAAKKDPEQLKVFINTRLAETWQSDSSAVKDINFIERLEPYDPNSLPDDVLLLTAGVDVQIDRLEVEVVGWGIDDESWSVEYLRFFGNPTSPAPWLQLGSLLEKQYQRCDGLKLRIAATCIDTGGELAPDNIRAFSEKHKKRNVMPIKGVAGQGKPIFPLRRSRHKKVGTIYTIGVDTAKSHFYTQLRADKPGPNYCHFPAAYEDFDQYFEGLTSEKCIVKFTKGGRKKVWIKDTSVPNEPLDLRVYALAARKSIKVDLERRREALITKLATPTPDEEPKDEQPLVVEEDFPKQKKQRFHRLV